MTPLPITEASLTTALGVGRHAHLAALREVSEEIEAKYASLKAELPPRLRHFMEQASYGKALEFITGQEGAGA